MHADATSPDPPSAPLRPGGARRDAVQSVHPPRWYWTPNATPAATMTATTPPAMRIRRRFTARLRAARRFPRCGSGCAPGRWVGARRSGSAPRLTPSTQSLSASSCANGGWRDRRSPRPTRRGRRQLLLDGVEHGLDRVPVRLASASVARSVASVSARRRELRGGRREVRSGPGDFVPPPTLAALLAWSISARRSSHARVPTTPADSDQEHEEHSPGEAGPPELRAVACLPRDTGRFGMRSDDLGRQRSLSPQPSRFMTPRRPAFLHLARRAPKGARGAESDVDAEQSPGVVAEERRGDGRRERRRRARRGR